jgi:outer membrane protein OmpA-like peptidoglycan-associated protein
MKYNPLLLALFALTFPLALFAQQSDSPKHVAKDVLYEKSGGQGIQVTNVSAINSEHLDFSPAWYHDGMVFISSRMRGGFVDPRIGERYFQMYFTRLDPNGMPVKAETFATNLNTSLHEGPVSFSRSGDRIYFTSNNQKRGVQRTDATGRVRLRIFTAENSPQGWINIRSLPFNSDEFSSMHPSLSPDGERLYFSSDRPGGQGGYDLWYVDRQGAGWSEPVNMGPLVNSEGNEVFPFIHYSGFLFYSSDGLEDGPGGLDIYSLNTRNLPEASPQLLSTPFNSSHDDFGFILDDSGKKGFFSSDRPGGIGKDDIYSFQSHYSLAGEPEDYAVRVALMLRDERSGHPVSGARIFLLPKDAYGGMPGDALYDMEVTRGQDKDGQPLTLQLVRKKTLALENPDLTSDDEGMAAGAFRPDQSYLILVEKPGYQLGEVEYRSPLTPGTFELEVKLRSLTCFPMEGMVRNQKSGEPLAMVSVLVEAPGLAEPIRLQTDAQGQFSHCLPLAAQYGLSAGKDGYIPGRSRVNTSDGNYSEVRQVELLLLPFSNTAQEITPEPLKEGSVIVLENLYYDYNKSSLRPGSAAELDVVADMMRRYPEMEIELGAHTDCRGSESFNLRLSESRAESARNYLISRGIQPARIAAKGYGESRLRNHCKDGVTCSEEEHAVNRRTEIRITKLDSPVEVRYGKRG